MTGFMERRRQVAAMTRQGMSAPQIATILRVTERTVVRDRVATGCSRSACNRALTAEELLLAQQLLDDGCSVAEVARTLGCGEHVIHRRFPGRAWTREQMYDFLAAIQTARKKGVSV